MESNAVEQIRVLELELGARIIKIQAQESELEVGVEWKLLLCISGSKCTRSAKKSSLSDYQTYSVHLTHPYNLTD